MTVISPGGDFLELILNCNKNKFLAGNIPVIKSSLFRVVVVEERGGEDGRIVTCVTTFRAERGWCCEARARSHLEVGRRLIRVLYSVLLARREEKRREKRRNKKERREKRREKKERKREERREKREERREKGEERAPLPPVFMSSTPPCVVSKRLRAGVLPLRSRFETTHGSVLDMRTEGFFRAPSRATPHTFTPHHTPQTHTRTTNTTTCSRQHANTTPHTTSQHHMYTHKKQHTTHSTHHIRTIISTHTHITHTTQHTTSCQCHFFN